MKNDPCNAPINISVGAVAGTPANQQKNFKLQDITDEFWIKIIEITKNYSYSAIEFLNGVRKSENFMRGNIVVLDIDDGITIEEAIIKFDAFYGVIATTKSHRKSEKDGKPIESRDRFRVILFLKEPIIEKEVFKRVMTNLITEIGADQACKDLGRFYFPNPEQKVYWLKGGEYFDIEPYNVDKKKTLSKTKKSSSKALTTQKSDYIEIGDDWKIVSVDGTEATAKEWREEVDVDEKITVHCPFPEHNDSNPSAFIDKKENGSLFAYCNSCGRKGWNSIQKRELVIPDEIIIEDRKKEEVFISEFSNVLIQELPFIGDCKGNVIVELIISTKIPIMSYGANLYLYVRGFWEKHKNDEIELKIFVKAAIKKITGLKRPSRKLVDYVHNELLYEFLDMPEINDILINFHDSILKIKDGVFFRIPQDKKYKKLYKLDFSYDETETCPKVDKFLMEVIEEQEAIDLLWEFLGSCFISNDFMKVEKCVMFVGSGANGKSVFLDLLRELLGKMNISTVSLRDMGVPERRHSMIGKLLNIASEGSSSKFDTEDFKAIISRENLPVRQLYNNAVDTNDFPRLIFATNHLPYTGGDSSDAIMRRTEIIGFDRVFREDEQDKQLLQKLLPELPGVMNRVLEGMQRLLKNQRLTKSPKVEKGKLMYEMQIDPVKFFVNELAISYDASAKIYSSKLLYDKFKDFCKDSGIYALNKQNFSKNMCTIFGKLQHSNKLYGWRLIVENDTNSTNEIKKPDSPYS